MGDRTGIEWTDATWTPIRAHRVTGQIAEQLRPGWHCEHVSEGCRNCYAEAMNKRLGTGLDFKPGHRKHVALGLDEKLLLQPLHWKRPRLIFVCSMTDLFADFVPDEFIDRMFAVMALCPQHTFQVLTKRPARMRAYVASRVGLQGNIGGAAVGIALEHGKRVFGGITTTYPAKSAEARDLVIERVHNILPNVWLGTSVEDQPAADARIPELLATPAAVRFLSCEPLLGPLDIRWALSHPLDIAAGFLARGQFSPGLETLRRLDWAIVGGESGRDARPLPPEWARSVRDQCASAGVPFTFKQWGSCLPCSWDGEDEHGQMAYVIDEGHLGVDHDKLGHARVVQAHGREFARFPHKKTGRKLDGVIHDGKPRHV